MSKGEVSELLKPRVKLIADWPGCNWPVGTIFPSNFADFKKWPHLFEEMKWWEDRTPDEMPEYIKEATGKIWRVKNWTNGTMQIEGGNAWRIVPNVMCFYEPATETEYQLYLCKQEQEETERIQKQCYRTPGK